LNGSRELRKGFCKDNELWCMRVNKLVNKVVSEHAHEIEQQEDAELDVESLCKLHKKNLKYAEKNMSQVRTQVQATISSLGEGADRELLLKHKEHIRKLVALETLFLNVCLLILVPQGARD